MSVASVLEIDLTSRREATKTSVCRKRRKAIGTRIAGQARIRTVQSDPNPYRHGDSDSHRHRDVNCDCDCYGDRNRNRHTDVPGSHAHL